MSPPGMPSVCPLAELARQTGEAVADWEIIMIEKISASLAQLQPNWLSRVAARSGQAGSPEAELRKLLGEPLPKTIDPRDLPRDLAALFAAYGMLEKIKKKLEWISRRKGGKIIPAENTIACVDDEDNIYMGVGFLKKHKDDEEVIAGVMAHEWGHMISELEPGMDLSHLSWDQMFDVRKDEEAAADAFAGRALYLMGYEIEKLIEFFKNIEKIDKNSKNQKYHSAEIRGMIIREAFKAQIRAINQMQKLFGSQSTGFADQTKSRLIAVA